jgi:SAM-dependent methyltransferase
MPAPGFEEQSHPDNPRDHHLEELRIALDQTNPARILPPPMSPQARILDIGCGAGQSLIAAYPDRLSFGVDLDFDALKLGRSLTDRICFAAAKAEALPFRDGQFDMVFARVSLPYTNIALSLREIRRVLKRGGQIWLLLHRFGFLWGRARTAGCRRKLFFLYIILNSLMFHFLRRQFSLFGRYESFQTNHGISRALTESGFDEVRIVAGTKFVVTARTD